MNLSTIDRDFVSGLSLLKDANDPPRYYVQWKQRRDLIAIGDEALARQRFAVWRERGMEKMLAMEAIRRRRAAQLRAGDYLRRPEVEAAGA